MRGNVGARLGKKQCGGNSTGAAVGWLGRMNVRAFGFLGRGIKRSI